MAIQQIVFCLLLFFILSCNKSSPIDSFNGTSNCTLVITKKTNTDEHVYIYNLIPETIIIDSLSLSEQVITSSFKIENVARYGIGTKKEIQIFIASKDTIDIHNNSLDPINISIEDNPLNNELHSYKNASKKILNEVSVYFPELQRARLNNDSDKLKEINDAIKQIETEHIEHALNYIREHPSSFVSLMILHDLQKNEEISIFELKELYELIDKSLKNTAEATIIRKKISLS